MTSEAEIVVGYEFDRDAVWAKVQGRKAVFLDTMVWIAMADGKPEGQTIKDKLRARVQSGDLFCPLSRPVIWELYKQDFSKLRTATLMEEFSLNVCFAPYKDVFAWEIERLARRLAGQEDERCSEKMLFTSIIGFVASTCTLAYPLGSTEDYVRDCSKLIFGHLDKMGLTALMKLQDDGAAASIFKNMAPLPYQSNAKYFHEYLKGDRSKVRLIEEQSVVESYIAPVIEKLPASLTAGLARFFQGVAANKHGGKLSALLAECPAISNHIEAMTRNSEDPNRKDKVNDFFDLEMMPVPLAYADVFVTLDKRTRERFLKPGDFLKRSRCKFCPTYAELECWLDAI